MKLQINGEERNFADNLTLAAVVEQLGVKADRVAIELNKIIVRRDAWAATRLRDGDRLEVVHFVGGGAPEHVRRLSSFASRRRAEDLMKTSAPPQSGALALPLDSPVSLRSTEE